jgi:hypothetical protein
VQKPSKEQFTWVMVLLAITLVVASAPRGSSTEAAPAKVFGHVYRAGTLQPIEDAQVQTDYYGNHTTFTDSSGYYNLTLPSGDYFIEAVAANYSLASWLVLIGEKDVLRDFYLLPTDAVRYAVSGSVFEEESGELVTTALVSIPDGGFLGYDGIHGPNGTYSFLLPNGTYELHASAWGYGDVTAEVVIDGSNVTKDLSMSRLNEDGTQPNVSRVVLLVAIAGTAIVMIVALVLIYSRKRP